MIRTLKGLVEPGMIRWDVGANVGYISRVLVTLVGTGGEVHAFEPSTHAFATLSADAAPGLTAHHFAVADKECTQLFSDWMCSRSTSRARSCEWCWA